MRFLDSKSILLAAAVAAAVILLPGTVAAISDAFIKEHRFAHDFNAEFESSTRNLKEIPQIAENVTIVSKEQIRDMNAHNVAEILNRVSGLYVSSAGLDFRSNSLVFVEGSHARQVLFLLDGFAWNFSNNFTAITNNIPVEIIERIEIVKGPAASSSWGSAPAGVVNIISKRGEDLLGPAGMVQMSYGARDTWDLRSEISGRTTDVDYYTYFGAGGSNGLVSTRKFFSSESFAKLNMRLTSKMEACFTIGASRPDTDLGPLPSIDSRSEMEDRAFFATGSLDAHLSDNLRLNLSFHHFRHRFVQSNETLGLNGPAGELFMDAVYDEATTGAKGKLVLNHGRNGRNVAVFGVDFSRGELDQTILSGERLVSAGAPPVLETTPSITKWAVYFNDSIQIGRSFCLTPGIRVDRNNINSSFVVSPRLGLTFRPWESKDTILRFSVSRGSSQPPLSWTSGGALFLDPNPSLEPEDVWSFQAGVESIELRYLRFKATVFHYKMEDAIFLDSYSEESPVGNDMYINNGDLTRQGVELEIETLPVFGINLWGGVAYTNLDPADVNTGASDIYTYNLALKYNNEKDFTAEIFGHFIWWDDSSEYSGSYDDFIWDLNVRKKVWVESGGKRAISLFFTVHNLFSDVQHWVNDYIIPERWLEAGLRIEF